jgi:hypothetical protein
MRKFSFAGLVLPRPAAHRALMVSPPNNVGGPVTATLRVLDGDSFTQDTSTPLETVTQEALFDLVSVSDDRVAFLGGARFGSKSHLHIVRSSAAR